MKVCIQYQAFLNINKITIPLRTEKTCIECNN